MCVENDHLDCLPCKSLVIILVFSLMFSTDLTKDCVIITPVFKYFSQTRSALFTYLCLGRCTPSAAVLTETVQPYEFFVILARIGANFDNV